MEEETADGLKSAVKAAFYGGVAYINYLVVTEAPETIQGYKQEIDDSFFEPLAYVKGLSRQDEPISTQQINTMQQHIESLDTLIINSGSQVYSRIRLKLDLAVNFYSPGDSKEQQALQAETRDIHQEVLQLKDEQHSPYDIVGSVLFFGGIGLGAYFLYRTLMKGIDMIKNFHTGNRKKRERENPVSSSSS